MRLRVESNESFISILRSQGVYTGLSGAKGPRTHGTVWDSPADDDSQEIVDSPIVNESAAVESRKNHSAVFRTFVVKPQRQPEQPRDGPIHDFPTTLKLVVALFPTPTTAADGAKTTSAPFCRCRCARR